MSEGKRTVREFYSFKIYPVIFYRLLLPVAGYLSLSAGAFSEKPFNTNELLRLVKVYTMQVLPPP
jgi:hypothetical protein